MSKKRGLSLEEKREKMLQIFYESQDFFLLKELEKLGPKKGVITQSVKDVIQSLVDDDLVLKDKIGTSVYFWSLPSSAGNQLKNVSDKLKSDLESSNKRYKELVEQSAALKKGREESDEREVALTELKGLQAKHNELKEELAKYADNDPAAFEAMSSAPALRKLSTSPMQLQTDGQVLLPPCKRDLNLVCSDHDLLNVSSCLKMADNIFTLRQWCSKNFPQATEQLDNLFKEVGVTDEFDYLELAPALPLNSVSVPKAEGTP
ncbi:unnamed protein product [Linum tenue]|uniref:Meiotic nuclear division protein 1 homolog n=1 Tax=Linum tenue TaxID=586396 RepID=A0AAV0S9K1_9ROSI|nr:unnamed protein product [Linum tenue]